MAASSNITSDHASALEFRKVTSSYLNFQWKQQPMEGTVKKMESRDVYKQYKSVDYNSDYISPGKKTSGFFRNIKKRLWLRNITLCKSKQKVRAAVSSNSYETDDSLAAVPSEKPAKLSHDNDTIEAPHILTPRIEGETVEFCKGVSNTSKDKVSPDECFAEGLANAKSCSDTEDEDVDDKTLSSDDISEERLSRDEDILNYFVARVQNDTERCNGNQEENLDCLSVRKHSVAEPQATKSKEVIEAPSSIQMEEDRLNDPKVSLTEELLKLSKYGWYWGPISGDEADAKLINEPDGAFLVRDSSDDRYLLTLSFKSSGKLLHSRMEHSGGLFSLCTTPEGEGFSSVAALIDHCMSFSQSAVFCYSRPKYPGSPSFPVRLTKPVSRFTQVRSLQYLCRFIIRQNTRLDNIHKLPLPKPIRGYIEEAHY